MGEYYILDGHEVRKCENVIEWGEWFEKADRKVAKTLIGDVCISTVFLGLNHRIGDGPPQIFETMVFGGEKAEEMSRYSTWEEAEKGHGVMVDLVKSVKSMAEKEE